VPACAESQPRTSSRLCLPTFERRLPARAELGGIESQAEAHRATNSGSLLRFRGGSPWRSCRTPRLGRCEERITGKTFGAEQVESRQAAHHQAPKRGAIT